MKSCRFATIGTNFIVDEFFAGAAREPRFKAEAVYSRTIEKGRAFASKHSVNKVYTSLEELACDNTIDAVYIASPNSCHAQQAILMMNHGKHVLCEKPLAPDVTQTREMIDASHRNGVVLMEAMRTIHSPMFGQIMDNIDRLGQLRGYTGIYCQYSSRYDRFKAGELPNAFNPQFGGGALRDLGIYCIYPMVMLLGRPQRVDIARTLLSSGIDGATTLTATYKQLTATVICSKIASSPQRSEIMGENGSLLFSKANVVREAEIVYRDGRHTDLTVPMMAEDMYYEISSFIDCIESGVVEGKLNNHALSLAVAEIMQA